MDIGRVNQKLLAKHLQSVVSFRAWRQIEVSEEMESQHNGKEDRKKDKACAQRQTMVYHGTGFIIHTSDNFALILSCAHTFAPFCRHGAAALDEEMRLAVDFFDQYSTIGHVSQINFAYDLSTVVVFLGASKRGSYSPVKFTENSPLMGFSDYQRDTALHSIICFPANQDQALFGTAVSGTICGPPRLGQDVDPELHSELKMVQFEMSGVVGCSGSPLFTQNLFVMGMWISRVEDVKFGVLLDSICEWLQKTYNIKETSMNTVVAKIGLLYSEKLALNNGTDS